MVAASQRWLLLLRDGCCCSEMVAIASILVFLYACINLRLTSFSCCLFLVLKMLTWHWNRIQIVTPSFCCPPNPNGRHKPVAMYKCWNVPDWILFIYFAPSLLLQTDTQNFEMLVVWSFVSCEALLISLSPTLCKSKIVITGSNRYHLLYCYTMMSQMVHDSPNSVLDQLICLSLYLIHNIPFYSHCNFS